MAMDQQSADPVSALCELAEASGDRFQAAELVGRYGTSLRLLTDLGALEAGAPLRTVTCHACDGDHLATVEFDGATRRHSYFCPEAGLVTVDDTDLATLHFDPGWLVGWLIRELPVSSPVRRRELVRHQVWHLGDTRCGETLVTVIFACRVSSQAALDRLASLLRPVRPVNKGLVITTSPHVAREIRLPNGYEFLDLREIARGGPGELTLDTARLGSWIRGMDAATGKGAPSRSGRPSPEAHIIQIYCDRRSRGRPVVTTQAEAIAICKEMARQAPDQKVPNLSTVRRHVARIRREAASP